MTEQKVIPVSPKVHRRIEIISTLKKSTMKDIVTEAIENYEIKHRLTDMVNSIIR